MALEAPGPFEFDLPREGDDIEAEGDDNDGVELGGAGRDCSRATRASDDAHDAGKSQSSRCRKLMASHRTT